MIVQAIMVVIVWIIFNLLMREKPKTPPSAVASVKYEPLDFKSAFKAIFSNRNFLMLVIAYALPFGAIQAVGTLMSNIFTPFKYSPAELAMMGLILLFTGIAGAVTVGIVIDKTGYYKKTMHTIGFGVLSTCAFILSSLIYWHEVKALIFIGFALLGFCAIGYVPLCLSYGAELTFPLQPALINGTLTLIGSFSSFLIATFGAFLVKEGSDDDNIPEEELLKIKRWRGKYVLIVVIVTTFIATILSFIIKEDLRRLTYGDDEEVTSGKKRKPAWMRKKEA